MVRSRQPVPKEPLKAPPVANDAVPQIVRDTLHEPGRPIDAGTKQKMESKFSRDFSNVRIHDDARAAQSAAAIGASAYAFGHDIVFGSGYHSAGAPAQARILTHELSHVAQTSGDLGASPFAVSSPSDVAEREATRVAGSDGPARTTAAGSGATVHRTLPIAAEVLEIVLTAVIVAQEQQAISMGSLVVAREMAYRFGSPPQPKKADYIQQVLHVGRNNAILPNVRADVYVRWSGNDFGEIGGAYIWVDPDHPQFTHSSLNISFTPLNDLPREGEDPRAWSIQWIYSGRFDPVGAGDYEFDGKFEINAFGGFKNLEHKVVDHSTGIFLPDAYDIVQKGDDRIVQTPPLPPNTRVTTKAPIAPAK